MSDILCNKRKLSVKYDPNPIVKKSKMQTDLDIAELDDFDMSDFFNDDFDHVQVNIYNVYIKFVY